MVLDPPQDTEVTLSASHGGGSWKSLDQRGRLRSWAFIKAATPTASLGPIWHLGPTGWAEASIVIALRMEENPHWLAFHVGRAVDLPTKCIACHALIHFNWLQVSERKCSSHRESHRKIEPDRGWRPSCVELLPWRRNDLSICRGCC